MDVAGGGDYCNLNGKGMGGHKLVWCGANGWVGGHRKGVRLGSPPGRVPAVRGDAAG